MTLRTRRVRRRLSIACLVSCALVSSLALGSSTSAGAGPRVLDPDSTRYGRSSSELAGDWYNWAVQFPLETNPIVEDGAVDCTRGQHGRIWYLAGNFAGLVGSNPSNRTCTVPGDKALFFPLANVLYWEPEDATTVEGVRAKSNADMDPVSTLTLSIDGADVGDLFAYRAQSPPGGFSLRFGPLLTSFLPPDASHDPRVGVADGFWILLAPLHRGFHEIHFTSASPAFHVEVTYGLTVR